MYRVNYNGLVGFSHPKDNTEIVWLVKTIQGVTEVLKEELTFFNKVETNLKWL